MSNRLTRAYVEAFLSGSAAECPDCRLVDEPGIHGTLSSGVEGASRLLVTDDRGHDTLAALLPRVRVGTVRVFTTATHSSALVSAVRGWTAREVTVMLRPDLTSVPRPAIPEGLSLRTVRRDENDLCGEIALEDAVALACLANPAAVLVPDRLAAHLRSLPSPVFLHAAVDEDSVVRATSGSRVSGELASVFFVDTDPAWRGRGIGSAMTAAALRSARSAGARRASLDASDVGLAIYLRLGFEAVARATQFSRDG